MRKKLIGRWILSDPRVCRGKLTFAGTRVPVETVLHFISRGMTIQEILADWPGPAREAVEGAVDLAAAALNHQY